MLLRYDCIRLLLREIIASFLYTHTATSVCTYVCLCVQVKVLVNRTSSRAVVESVFLFPSSVTMQSTAVMVQMRSTAEVSPSAWWYMYEWQM